jgi:aerobic-type carbon monoxide dehydrogenase small subunit (CoxS/CutS family)
MKLNVNGTDVEIPANMAGDRLLWVLRDHLALNGPKYGCGVGACGACTVQIDGEAQRSCLVIAQDATGKIIVTLEGLGNGKADGLHPVQKAWIEASVPQCGYCQNGQIMTAAVLLAANPVATPDDIATAMDSVLCRCGTHVRIKAAIIKAQEAMKAGG